MRRRRGEGPGDCAICGRVVLPGEPAHDFLDPDRGRRHEVVCPLCPRRAVARGWVRAGVPAADRGASAA
jgi:hypothetical protein